MMFRGRRERREAELAEREEFRQLRRLLGEDVTNLGEQLSGAQGLDVAALSDEGRGHYQQALDGYERAKGVAAAADDKHALMEAEKLIVESRFQWACAVALRDGTDLPDRRGECFFNPHHGPARVTVTWAPPMGSEREVDVCHSCRRRLSGGDAVDHRMVRVGDRHVPWWQVGAGDLEAVISRSHVISGDTPETSKSLAEAQARAAVSAVGIFTSPI